MISNFSLAIGFGWRLLTSKYKRSLFGLGWLVIAPLASLLVYVFVFGEVLKVKWPNAGHSGFDRLFEFGLMVFLGLSIFQFFSESFNRAVTVITDNPNLVSKVVFPLEVLSTATVFTSFFILLFNLILCMAVVLIGGLNLGSAILYLPYLLTLMFMFTVGLCLFISALGVFFRDLTQFVALLTGAMVFLLPVFFPASTFPTRFRFVIDYNPIAFYIDSIRNIIFLNQAPDSSPIFAHTSIAIIVFVLGLSFFRVLQRGFADVI